MTTATHNAHDTTTEAVLFMAFESIGKSNGLFHRLPRYPVRGPARTPRAAHPGARSWP
jgi:hypothetical protein